MNAALRNWRGTLWWGYLVVGGVMTAAYLGSPYLKANPWLINAIGLSSSLAIMATP